LLDLARNGGAPRAAAPHPWTSFTRNGGRTRSVRSEMSGNRSKWPPLRLSKPGKTHSVDAAEALWRGSTADYRTDLQACLMDRWSLPNTPWSRSNRRPDRSLWAGVTPGVRLLSSPQVRKWSAC